MKKLLFLLSAAVAGVSFAEQADHWTYNGSTITDGEWTFAATVKADTTDMTVGACAENGYPDAPSLLDFSKPVSNGEITYDIVTLDTKLGATTDTTYGKDQSTTPAGLAVGELRLPDNGKLTTVKLAAFGLLKNCTKVTPLLPDSITTLGRGAFYGCNAEQDVRLYGLTTVSYSIFYGSKATSVTFGPNLHSFEFGWCCGPFSECGGLTNVTFDAAMSGAIIPRGVNGSIFENCSSLTGTLDLSGFSSLGFWAFKGTKYETVILGKDLVQLTSDLFNGMNSLAAVKFYGPPPTTLGTPVFGSLPASQIIATYVMSEDPDIRAQWAALTAGGELNKTSSTWHPDYVVAGSADKRFLVLPSSGGGGDLGDWVYDDNAHTLTRADGKWQFKATKSFIKLMLGVCTKWPDTVDELDFSARITDTEGTDMILYEINTVFADGGSSEWGYFANGSPKITEAAQYVGRVVLPEEGLERICRGAFAGCTALTNVVPYLPDSVSYLGAGAFFKVPAAQDVRVNVPKLGYHAFGYAGLTSITCGPKLKELQGFYANTTFSSCKNMTNIWFDAGISDAKLDSSSDGVFGGCSKLKGCLDLRGFSKLGESPNIGGTKLQEVVIGDAVNSLSSSFFGNCGTITNVIFTGRPPVVLGVPYFGSYLKTLTLTTVYKGYLKATNSAGRCWKDYANGRCIWPAKSTWAAEYVASGINLKNRPLLCPDGPVPGLMMIVK